MLTRGLGPTARRRTIVGTVAVLLVGISPTLVSAQPEPARTVASRLVRAHARSGDTLRGQLGSDGAPAAHIRPAKGGTDAGVLVDGRTAVRKAKTVVTLARTELRTYANEIFTNKNQLLTSRSPAWSVVHRHGRHVYGSFPVTTATVLGFGAIPIVATLHLSQVARHGLIRPLIIRTKTQTVPPFATQPTRVDGPVNIRISDVFVDRVPLHVGDHCRTATPMHLHLVGISPGYNLFTGGPLNGNQTIPPFSGCGTGGDDLDPLITGMISGPGNPLHMIQGGLGAWNPKTPHDCSGCKPPAHHSS